MLILPNGPGNDLCGKHPGPSRRDVLRVGGSALLGATLGGLFRMQRASADQGKGGGPGWGNAKSIIMLYLQGGPSHLDLWDPKDNVPENVKSPFKAIDTKLPGIKFTELMPKLASTI